MIVFSLSEHECILPVNDHVLLIANPQNTFNVRIINFHKSYISEAFSNILANICFIHPRLSVPFGARKAATKEKLSETRSFELVK
jgi:hypothetical protein